MSSPAPDVVVVGAGFAGVTAARELVRAGLDVVVLEARDRIGGRTWRRDDVLGSAALEMGGAWVHWFQPHVFAELTRYGLDLLESDGTAEPAHGIWIADGARHRAPADEVLARMTAVAMRVAHDAREVLQRPYHLGTFRPDQVAAVDGLSMQDRIDELDLSAEDRDLANAFFSAIGSARCQDFGLVAGLRWLALSGWDVALMFDTTARYTIATGTRSLIDAMAADAGVDIRLGTPVTAVAQDRDGVRVTTGDGRTVRARAAVVTAPLNTLGRIRFDPPLSTGKRRGIAEGQAGRGTKVWVRIRGDVPAPFFAYAPDTYAINCVQTEQLCPDGQLLAGFGPDAAALDVTDPGAVQAAMTALLGDGVEVVACAGHDWTADPWSRGTWPMLRAGQVSQVVPELQAPDGRVLLAGSECADGWNGFIDGAIESGLRAARTLLRGRSA